MIEEKYRAALVIDFVRKFGIIFSLAIIAISIAGMLIELCDPSVRDGSSLFALGNGLQYSSILQIAGFALIIAFFTVLLFSEYLQTRIRFIIRGFLLLLVTLVTSSVFAFAFNWFPSNDIRSWLRFVLCTIGCFIISFTLTLLKLKLEGKKYTKLLKDYKGRHNV